jgi:hypothetical protein
MAEGAPSIWGRAVGDPEFREALIEDPLRALAEVGRTEVSADQVRRLERMSRSERAELVQELIRRLAGRRAREAWGDRFWTPDEPGPVPGESEPSE